MKICLMSSSCIWQSCTAQIYVDYANHFVERGHDVTLMFFRRFKIEGHLDERVQIVFSPKWISRMKGPNDFNPFETVFRIFKVLRKRYDIIHVCPGHRPALFLPAILSKLLIGNRIIDEWWEWFAKEGLGVGKRGVRKVFAELDDLLELRTKKYYDLILPITSTLKKRLSATLDAKAIVLHGGMNSDHFVQYEKSFARQAIGLTPNLIIVGMSNLCDGDHEDNLPFYRAFRRVSENRAQLRLLVSGNQHYIEKVVRPLVGGERLINIGWQPLNVFNQYLSSCDLFALPFPSTARNRGRWPNKFTDYVWLKRPVITNQTGDIKEIMETHNLGFCCENSEVAYEQVLSNAYETISGKGQIQIDIDNCGLMTTWQRREAILGFYRQLMYGSEVGLPVC